MPAVPNDNDLHFALKNASGVVVYETPCLGEQPGGFSGLNIPFSILAPGDYWACLLYTSDAADERSSVDLGGRRIIKKKRHKKKKTKKRVKKKNKKHTTDVTTDTLRVRGGQE